MSTPAAISAHLFRLSTCAVSVLSLEGACHFGVETKPAGYVLRAVASFPVVESSSTINTIEVGS
jgi:hypothetical protein